MPSGKFLFFQSSRMFERLILPGYLVIFFCYMFYGRFGLTYALFVTPRAHFLALTSWIIASLALTLISLNTHWAYEGNFTRWQARPFKHFNAGSKWWCTARHGSIFFLCMAPLFIHFTQALPHGLLLYTGTPEVKELVVQSKSELSVRYRRSCTNRVVASSSGYRTGNLCLDSDQLYAEIKVGDTLIVEGNVNWVGLLVDKPLALRNADNGLERSVRNIIR